MEASGMPNKFIVNLVSFGGTGNLVRALGAGITLFSLAVPVSGEAAEYPEPAIFDRMLSLCAVGAGIELDADLRGSILGLYESDRTEGTATLNTVGGLFQHIPDADRLKAYELYTRCITDILASFTDDAGSGPAADPLAIGPTQTTWSAQFARWPTGENAEGSYAPTSNNDGASLSIQPIGNAWVGPGPITIVPVNGDFQADVAFYLPSNGDLALNVSLGATGRGDRTSLEFYLSRWAAGQPTYSVNVFTLQGINVTSNRRIAERMPLAIPFDHINWAQSNILSIRRVGGTVGYYLNDTLMTSFDATVFRINQIAVSAAFPGEVRVNSITMHEPR